MVRTNWTEAMLREEALKYNTRGEFQKGSPNAYVASTRRGIITSISLHMHPSQRSPWTLEELRIEASLYNTKKEFQLGSKGAYQAARSKGFLKLICSHMVGRFLWSFEKLHKEALRYTTRYEFERANKSAYTIAKKLGVFEDVVSHMTSPLIFWKEIDLRNEALKYQNREDFRRGSRKAYYVAYYKNILDELCIHMNNSYGSDNNVIYIYRIVSLGKWNDKYVYKVGVTSLKLGLDRPTGTSKKNEWKIEMIILKEVTIQATKLEIEILKFGEVVPMNSNIDGRTEVRALTDEDLLNAITLINLHSN